MNTDTIQPTARTALVAPVPRAPSATRRSTGGHRIADYLVDVFFIMLLAAPFLIFESPATVQDAVAPVHIAAPQDAGPAYGPE